jgi:hypothetical protein
MTKHHNIKALREIFHNLMEAVVADTPFILSCILG